MSTLAQQDLVDFKGCPKNGQTLFIHLQLEKSACNLIHLSPFPIILNNPRKLGLPIPVRQTHILVMCTIMLHIHTHLWYDMIWCDVIWYIWLNMIWHDMLHYIMYSLGQSTTISFSCDCYWARRNRCEVIWKGLISLIMLNDKDDNDI